MGLETLLYGIVYSNNDSVPLLCGPSWFITTLFLAEVLFYFIHRIVKGDTRLIFVLSIVFVVEGYIESVARDDIVRPWHFASVPVAIIFCVLDIYLQMNISQIDMKV